MYCQKCRIPLKADDSLENLNPAAFELLVGTTNRSRKTRNVSNLNYPQERKILYEQTTKEPQSPLYRRHIAGPAGEDGGTKSVHPDMSYIEITESQVIEGEATQDKSKPQDIEVSGNSLAQQLQRHEKLFAVLSSRSEIDHPICSECSTMLVSALNARLGSATRERDAYASFLKSVQQSTSRDESDDGGVQAEEEAFQELTQLEEQKRRLEEELATLDEENRQLGLEEQQFWQDRNAFDEKMHGLDVELASLQQKYAHDQQQLERLQRTNVYNDTFCIGHDGYFGTINNLRLGRLSNPNVEWAEINAAWGQTLLLMATVAERLSFQFQGYRLRPLGSTSRIEKVEWPQQSEAAANPPPKVTPLDLFSSGDMPLGRVFNHRRFDAGMVAFLDCLSQLGSFVEKTSRVSVSSAPKSAALVLPYPIEGDKIGGVSIRLGVGFSQDENFTKACKYALTCCKFLLAHVSNLESVKQ